MARNSFASSAHARPRAKNAKPTPDSKLDLSDIPESTAAELRRARRVGRPAQWHSQSWLCALPTAFLDTRHFRLRVSPKLLRQLRRMAAKQSKPYQTLIHELLEKSARKVA
jgi:predicted HicB family RNase H-like nuclease